MDGWCNEKDQGLDIQNGEALEDCANVLIFILWWKKKHSKPRLYRWWWLHNHGACAWECVCYGEQTAQLVTHSVMAPGCDQTRVVSCMQLHNSLLYLAARTRSLMKELCCLFLSCALMRNMFSPLLCSTNYLLSFPLPYITTSFFPSASPLLLLFHWFLSH